MKAASEPSALAPAPERPGAAVLVALAGAALVAIGLLLVGMRESRVSQWMPVPPAVSQAAG